MATEGQLAVVGADGSVQSVAALRWAAGYAAAPAAVSDEVRAQMAEALSKAVVDGAGGFDVEPEVVYGHPAHCPVVVVRTAA